MLVQLSSDDGFPETAVKARKKPFMMAVAITSKKNSFIWFTHLLKPEVSKYHKSSLLGMYM